MGGGSLSKITNQTLSRTMCVRTVQTVNGIPMFNQSSKEEENGKENQVKEEEEGEALR